MKKVIFTLVLLIALSGAAFSAMIDKVEIVGNKRIPTSRITPYIIKSGAELSLDALDESIKDLYKTGMFLNIETDLYVDGSEFVLKYKLVEMPLIGSVTFNGNKDAKTSNLLEKVILKQNKQLTISALEQTLEALRAYYESENMYGTKITFRIEDRTANSVNVIFDIVESDKSKIYNIRLYGNDNISRLDILKTIPTKERGFWSLITGSGNISREYLVADRELIRMMYLEKGYAQVSLGEPDVVFNEEDPSMANLILKIKEGKQFFVRSVAIDGYENIPLDKLLSIVKLKANDVFNIKMYQSDIVNLTEEYTSSGYAYANIEPIISLDDEANAVDIVYKIEENTLVNIGRIAIKGNLRSYDHVIRRQIDQMEGELYSSKLIREAKANAMATGYFESVQIIEKANGKDIIDLEVVVVEQSTGTFTVGAAYSSVDGIMGMLQVSRNNFMGWGHSMSIKGEISTKRLEYSLSYTEPWLFDKPISLGGDLFSLEREWYEYTRNSTGGSLRLGHALIKRRLYVNYRLSWFFVDIYDIDVKASKYIKEQKGVTETRSIAPSLVWNSLDNPVETTRGNKSSFTFDYAGSFLGGDANFIKLTAESSQFIPLFWGTVLMFHGEVGYITPNKSRSKIPIDERFRLGGINSVRGFSFGEISPVDEEGYEYGGDKYFMANAEFIFPIKKDIKLKGLVFFDIGQVYNEKEDFFTTGARKSVGIGLRWITPMGPFRLEYGYKLDKKPGEEPYRWEFSIGGTF